MSYTVGKADWTIMVYIGAKDILDSFAIESLKQIKSAAGDGVIVAAQLDASGRKKIRRFIFDGKGHKDASLESDVVERFLPDNKKAPADFLKDFIIWVHSRPECEAKHYCLICWTDGSLSTEIPTGKEPQKKIDDRRRQDFLLPVQLRLALEEVRKTGRDKFDIIGMDACNMSMVEDTYELRDCAEFLIASEEEIPNHSWPYAQLLPIFRDHKDDIPVICKMVAREYKRAYEDYIFNKSTGLNRVTLSSMRLARMPRVTGPLDELAVALLQASIFDANTRRAIVSARQKAMGFVVGLFVDLRGFSDLLRTELTIRNIRNEELKAACTRVCDAITTLDEETQVVIENATFEPHRCHGLSIFLPLVTAADQNEINRVRDSKGGTDVLNKSRQERMAQIVGYYSSLKLAHDTRWLEFITVAWPRCLAEEQPSEVCERLSVQACA